MAIKVSPKELARLVKTARKSGLFRTLGARKGILKSIQRNLRATDITRKFGKGAAAAKALKGGATAGALGTIGAGALATAALAIPAHEAGKFIGRKSVELRRKPKISARLRRRIALEKVRRAERIAKGRRLLKERGK